MSDSGFNLLADRMMRRPLLLAILVVLAFGALGEAGAQTADERMQTLRSELDAAYDVIPLSDGWALRPRDSNAGFQAVEVTGSELAIDGTLVSEDEIRARLGSLAAPVIAFANLESADREYLLSMETADVIEESEIESELREKEASEAEARAERRREKRALREVNRTDAQVVVGSSVNIESDEVTRDVLVVGGSLTIDGLVKGDAVAVGGPVYVYGEVTGDVAAVGGSVELESGARVEGDIVSVGGTVDKDPDAIVEGRIQEVAFLPALKIGSWHGPDISVEVSPVRAAFGLAWELFGVAVLVLLAALTLLIAKRPVERVGDKVGEEPWKSGLVGLLCQLLFFPLLIVLVVILVISIVGIPFLLLLPFALLALLLVGLLGYTAVALRVGRWSEDRFGWRLTSPFLALLVGIGLLEIWSLLGELLGLGPGPLEFFAVMFAIFGGLVAYAAWTVGFGGAVLSRLGAAPTSAAPGEGGNSSWQEPGSDQFVLSDEAQQDTSVSGDDQEPEREWLGREDDPQEPSSS